MTEAATIRAVVEHTYANEPETIELLAENTLVVYDTQRDRYTWRVLDRLATVTSDRKALAEYLDGEVQAALTMHRDPDTPIMRLANDA